MPCASFSMLDGPGGTQVSLTSFFHSEVNQIIHIIVQDQDGQNNYIGLVHTNHIKIIIKVQINHSSRILLFINTF